MGRSSSAVDADRVPGAEIGSAEGAADGACGRPMRADAKRNRALLVAAAHDAFTENGAAASLEDIARRAGVGVGTLYRHFPSRQDLLEAVYVDEVQALCRSAGDFAGEPAWDALAHWFDRFVDYVATKKALVEEMMASMSRDAPVFRACHDAIYAAGEPLLARAQAEGVVRPDVEFVDVIRLVSGITMVKNASTADIRRVLAMALDGLRYQPPRLLAARPRPRLTAAARASAQARRGSSMPGRRSGAGTGRPRCVRSGTTPAQASPATSSGGSSGHPSDTLSDHSSIGRASTSVASSSRRVGRRSSAVRPGSNRSVTRSSARSRSAGSSTTVHRPKMTALR